MPLPAAYHLGGSQLSTLGTGAGQAGFGPHNFLSFKKAYGLWGAWGTTKRTAAAAAKSLQLCLTLCDPIDGSPPGSAVPGILQARTLEWVAISFSSA